MLDRGQRFSQAATSLVDEHSRPHARRHITQPLQYLCPAIHPVRVRRFQRDALARARNFPNVLVRVPHMAQLGCQYAGQPDIMPGSVIPIDTSASLIFAMGCNRPGLGLVTSDSVLSLAPSSRPPCGVLTIETPSGASFGVILPWVFTETSGGGRNW